MSEKLRTELHPEVQRLLERKRSRGDCVRQHNLSVEEARKLKESAIEEAGWLNDPEPVGSVRDYRIPSENDQIPIRIYNPKGEGPFSMLLWIHGGGWVRGSIDGTIPSADH